MQLTPDRIQAAGLGAELEGAGGGVRSSLSGEGEADGRGGGARGGKLKQMSSFIIGMNRILSLDVRNAAVLTTNDRRGGRPSSSMIVVWT